MKSGNSCINLFFLLLIRLTDLQLLMSFQIS